jgi:hypothetical protein
MFNACDFESQAWTQACPKVDAAEARGSGSEQVAMRKDQGCAETHCLGT